MNHPCSLQAARLCACLAALLTVAPVRLAAQDAASTAVARDGWADDPPVLSALVEHARNESELRVALDRYDLDLAALQRRYPVDYSPARRARLDQFYGGWQARLDELDFDALSQEGRIDYILLRNQIRFDREMLRLEEERWVEIAPLVPFADRLRQLQEGQFDRVRADPRQTAETMNDVATEVEGLTRVTADAAPNREAPAPAHHYTPAVAARAAAYVRELQSSVDDFNKFYSGYDPLYTWWVREPYERLHDALESYATVIEENLVGIKPGELPPIVGDPVLANGLRAYLAVEMIPYTADELIAIGWAEFERTEREFRAVSQAMGFGDDWQAALEYVKTLAPPPGEKPWVIFEIAEYSENFVESMDAITMPPLAREVWRLAMQTPEAQLRKPFFSGGETTRVSYPTSGMSHEDKLMSMRGNTPSFNFATVHHELIPGHHLQGFMTSRFNSHRPGTPFWGEGWALYWELLLWENDFPRSDEDRIGMLFWRLHRAARIVFSLNFQLGNWTPQQAIDFLVERVGHERANAEAEVRRTAIASPLYQIAYLIGGLQFYGLHRELVDSGRMTAREYHDAVLLGGRMPVEMVRARIAGLQLTRDYEAQWRFYEELPTR
ncbi:MAG: DUF885 domain-containing protein [Gemmatimonadota bacterium]|nr:MAG: DUF885 domain-containing protein [Gemmatimonadota bacterium]